MAVSEKVGGYYLLQQVGEGSHGSLYKAQKNGRDFALKIFHPNVPAQVLEEGQRLAGLSHPGLVSFVEEGRDGENPYLVTEWLEGDTLEHAKPPPDLSSLVTASVAILNTLNYLHEKGWIHGDLKSANLILSGASVKLIDLGLAHYHQEGFPSPPPSAKPTEPPPQRVPGGTLAYLAPELLLGRPKSPQSDLYALGVVLYRWMMGAYPFPSDTIPSVIRWHLFELPSRPKLPSSERPLPFGDFVLRLLSKNPADRPASARQAEEWLLNGMEGKAAPDLFQPLPGTEEEEPFELHGEAIRYYEGKGDLNPEETLLLAELRFFQGHLSKAVETLEGRGDPESILLRAKILTRMGRFNDAENLLEKIDASKTLRSGGAGEKPLRFAISYWSTRGILSFYLGRMESALMSFSEAEALANHSGETARLASTYNNLANVMLQKNWTEMAEKYFLRSVDLARESGDRIHEGMFQMSLGYFYHRRQRFADALKAYDESAAILSSVGQKTEWARTLLNRANLKIVLGDLDSAERDFKGARHIFLNRSLPYLAAYSLLIEGEILRRKGSLQEALDIFNRASLELSGLGREQDALWARLHQVECRLETKDFIAAKDKLESIQDKALAADPQVRGHYYFLKARLSWGLRREKKEIDSEFSSALEELREGEDEEALILLHYTWGAYLFHEERKAEAQEHLNQADAGLNAFSERLPAERREAYLLHSPREVLERMLKAMETPYLPVEQTNFPPSSGAVERILKSLQNELTGELDLMSLVEKVLDRLIEITQAERGFILLNEEPEPRIAVARKIDQRTLEDPEEKISDSIARQVLNTGEALMTVDAMSDERFSVTASVHQFKLRSILCLPFRTGEKILGAIYLDNRNRAGVFPPPLALSLKPFAEFIAQALKNARRFSDVQSTLKETRNRLARAEAELKIKYDYKNLVGRHSKMLEIFKILDRVTDVEIPVLILGESGVGKELVAKAVHYHGRRADHSFVSLNCQAVPEGLFESELFGHSKGSFTGALSDRMGLIEQAHRGTLFLDEIGDMPLSLQGKLLRVLQEGKFRRVGEREERPADCRILAATHRDLKAMIREGKFREDLWFRLNVVEIRIPPLRERLEDLPLLADHFLGEFAKRHGGRKMKIAPEAMALLARYPWPGNVRELENTITNACVFCEGESLNVESFRYKREIFEPLAPPSPSAETPAPPAISRSFREAKQDFEKRLLSQALKEASGNITRAAIGLKIARPQLSRMVKKYKIA